MNTWIYVLFYFLLVSVSRSNNSVGITYLWKHWTSDLIYILNKKIFYVFARFTKLFKQRSNPCRWHLLHTQSELWVNETKPTQFQLLSAVAAQHINIISRLSWTSRIALCEKLISSMKGVSGCSHGLIYVWGKSLFIIPSIICKL